MGNVLVLIEILVVFGGVIALAAWELRRTRRSLERDRAEQAHRDDA